MSGYDFPMRLFWGPHGGNLAHHGLRLDLDRFPTIAGLERVTELDYARGVVATVRIDSGPRRDLTPAEQAAVRAWLDTAAECARAAVAAVAVAVLR